MLQMAMLKSEFIPWACGKRLDTDGVPKNQPYQCTDLIKVAMDKCWEIRNFTFTLPDKNPRGFAKSLWENFSSYPQLRGKAARIRNTAFFAPKLGDIVVWQGDFIDKRGNPITGEAGHVAYAEGINTGTVRFKSLDQNWGNKYYTSEVNHKYDGIYGVIRMLLLCTITDLNVRSGPGTEYPKVVEYPKGTLVQPLEYYGNWARIGNNRWVSANYLE